MQSEWDQRDTYEIRISNAQSQPLVNLENYILPLHHIKLGLVKQHLKILAGKSPESYEYVMDRFRKLNKVKLKKDVLKSSEIKEPLKDNNFSKTAKQMELKVWEAFKWICEDVRD